MIVEAAPAVSGPRPSDRNIAIVAEDGAGIYKPSRHVDLIRDSFERQGKEPEAFVRFHVRRLERCAAPVIGNGSMQTIGASPTISSSGAWPMT